MGKPSSHLAPGGIALCLQQPGDVVENDHVTARLVAFAGQGRACTGQHAPADFAAQDDLFAPFRFTGVEMDARHVDELIEQRFVPRDVGQVFADAILEIYIQNGA